VNVTGGKPIAVLLQSISGVSAINPIVAFYDIHGGKREVLFFYFVLDTTRDKEGKELAWFFKLAFIFANYLANVRPRLGYRSLQGYDQHLIN
jgi:hypothetical protein